MVQTNRLLNFPAEKEQAIDDELKHSVQFHEITEDDLTIPFKNKLPSINIE